MSATLSYLEQLKSTFGDASDYKAAQLLDLTHQAVSAYRKKGVRMSDSTAVKLAQLLRLPPSKVIADLHAEVAKTDEERQFWERLKQLDFPVENGH